MIPKLIDPYYIDLIGDVANIVEYTAKIYLGFECLNAIRVGVDCFMDNKKLKDIKYLTPGAKLIRNAAIDILNE